LIHTTVAGEDIMGLFKKHGPAAQEPTVGAEGAAVESTAMESTATDNAVPQPAAKGRPKREVRAFRQVPPYEMNEELAERIAMRAYGDQDHDGRPDIPAAPFPG
jgi:hypothetical protein